MSVLTAVTVALTAICGGLVVLAAVVFADRPRGPLTAASTALLPYVLQLSWPCLVVGLVAQRWWLVAAATAGCLTALIAAAAAAPRGTVQADATGQAFRVVTANLFYGNDDGIDSWRAIEDFGPDLVLLQEASPRSAHWLPPAGWHVELNARTDAFGTAVLTRTPPLSVERFDLAGLPQLQIRLQAGDVTVTALSVHPQAPVSRAAHQRWRRQFRELEQRVRGDGAAVLVLGGDFNATPLHGPMREFRRRSGLIHARIHRRLQNTWPSGGHDTPPFAPRRMLALDHIFVRGAAVRSAQVLRVGRSDHYPLAVELALPRPG